MAAHLDDILRGQTCRKYAIYSVWAPTRNK